MPKPKAQSSLEYLLVAAAFLSCMLLFLPLITALHNTTVLGLDAANARSFIHELRDRTDELLLLGEGSSSRISSPVLTRWSLSASNGRIVLSLHSAHLPGDKLFTLECSPSLQIPETGFEGRASLELLRSAEGVSVTHT